MCFVALVAIAIANQTHIETNDHVKLAPGLEMLARLSASGLGGILGIYGVVFIRKVREAMFTFPLVWILGIWGMCLLSTVASPMKDVAFPHLVTFTSVVIFAPTAFAVLGTRTTVLVCLGSMIFTLALSWFLYLAMPEYGVMIEITDASGAGVERMGGTSHPNNLAGTSVLCIVCIIYLMIERKLSLNYCVAALALAFATLAMTGTRVAIVAGLAAMLFVYRGFFFRRDVFPMAATAAVGILFCSMILFAEDTDGMASRSIMRSVTRSGDVNEITSVTGRSEIWEYSIKKIGERPLFGWGLGLAKPLLESQQMLLHTHNVVLHLALASGVLAGIFCAFMFLNQLYVSIKGDYKLAAMISIVILTNSMTEISIFAYIPGGPTLLWVFALGWPVLDDGSL